MKKILIYKDLGTSTLCIRSLFHTFHQENLHKHFEIAIIDSRSLNNPEWLAQTHLIVFPGGRDVPYCEALNGSPNAYIREFVENGGRYLGICAGAYYGSSSIEFEKGASLEVCGQRELAFFPGIASGPAYGNGQFCYESEKGARIAFLKTASGRSAAYYNGGCAFIHAEKYLCTEVIACYEDIPGQPAAVIRSKVGQGHAILSGVHPEYTVDYLSQKVHFNSLIPALKEIEPMRKRLFQEILSFLI